jgi:hypothetical protein
MKRRRSRLLEAPDGAVFRLALANEGKCEATAFAVALPWPTAERSAWLGIQLVRLPAFLRGDENEDLESGRLIRKKSTISCYADGDLVMFFRKADSPGRTHMDHETGALALRAGNDSKLRNCKGAVF